MRHPLYRYFPPLLGALFIFAALGKLAHPGLATMALETLELPSGWAKAAVACATAFELYLGVILLIRLDLKYGLLLSTALMFAFTAYLFYLSTLAHPPSCGCLGLTGIFQNSRHEAILGLARNCAVLWGIRWTYERHFPAGISPARASMVGAGANHVPQT